MNTRAAIFREIADWTSIDAEDLHDGFPCRCLGDSLDKIDIVWALECEFDIGIEDEEAEEVFGGTVGDLVKLVEAKIEKV